MRCLVAVALVSLVSVKADDLIDEFNDPNMGIGFTTIPLNVWQRQGGGNNGMDAAGFFPMSDMGTLHKDAQQAVSIVTKVQDMNPYNGGYGTYGLAFHVTEEAQFWKYFEVAGHGKDVLVAGPGDGANHIPNTPDWRSTIFVEGKSYEWFAKQKNAILAEYNTVYKIHDYNEFDTNGLSPDGLAGVFVNEQRPDKAHPGPSDDTMCSFLHYANPSKSTWPIYGYKWHSLYIIRNLNCGTPTPTTCQGHSGGSPITCPAGNTCCGEHTAMMPACVDEAAGETCCTYFASSTTCSAGQGCCGSGGPGASSYAYCCNGPTSLNAPLNATKSVLV